MTTRRYRTGKYLSWKTLALGHMLDADTPEALFAKMHLMRETFEIG
jgi:hypothetical protein